MDEDVLQLMDFLDGDAECHFSIRPSGQHLQHAATAPPLDRGDSDGWPKVLVSVTSAAKLENLKMSSLDGSAIKSGGPAPVPFSLDAAARKPADRHESGQHAQQRAAPAGVDDRAALAAGVHHSTQQQTHHRLSSSDLQSTETTQHLAGPQPLTGAAAAPAAPAAETPGTPQHTRYHPSPPSSCTEGQGVTAGDAGVRGTSDQAAAASRSPAGCGQENVSAAGSQAQCGQVRGPASAEAQQVQSQGPAGQPWHGDAMHGAHAAPGPSGQSFAPHAFQQQHQQQQQGPASAGAAHGRPGSGGGSPFANQYQHTQSAEAGPAPHQQPTSPGQHAEPGHGQHPACSPRMHHPGSPRGQVQHPWGAAACGSHVEPQSPARPHGHNSFGGAVSASSARTSPPGQGQPAMVPHFGHHPHHAHWPSAGHMSSHGPVPTAHHQHHHSMGPPPQYHHQHHPQQQHHHQHHASMAGDSASACASPCRSMQYHPPPQAMPMGMPPGSCAPYLSPNRQTRFRPSIDADAMAHPPQPPPTQAPSHMPAGGPQSPRHMLQSRSQYSTSGAPDGAPADMATETQSKEPLAPQPSGSLSQGPFASAANVAAAVVAGSSGPPLPRGASCPGYPQPSLSHHLPPPHPHLYPGGPSLQGPAPSTVSSLGPIPPPGLPNPTMSMPVAVPTTSSASAHGRPSWSQPMSQPMPMPHGHAHGRPQGGGPGMPGASLSHAMSAPMPLRPVLSAPRQQAPPKPAVIDPDRPDEGWMAAHICYKRFSADPIPVPLPKSLIVALSADLQRIHQALLAKRRAQAAGAAGPSDGPAPSAQSPSKQQQQQQQAQPQSPPKEQQQAAVHGAAQVQASDVQQAVQDGQDQAAAPQAGATAAGHSSRQEAPACASSMPVPMDAEHSGQAAAAHPPASGPAAPAAAAGPEAAGPGPGPSAPRPIPGSACGMEALVSPRGISLAAAAGHLQLPSPGSGSPAGDVLLDLFLTSRSPSPVGTARQQPGGLARMATAGSLKRSREFL